MSERGAARARVGWVGRIFAVVMLAACASSSPPAAGSADGSAPIAELTSDGGAYHVTVRSGSGAAPARGQNVIELDVTDPATGAPITGLAITIVPWMPAMGHGSSVTPMIAEAPGGRYVASQVDLFMPGTWVLRTTIIGTTTDHLAPQFPIE